MELCKAVLHLVAIALRLDFKRGHHLAVSSRPFIKHQKIAPFQFLRLQGLLQDIQFRH